LRSLSASAETERHGLLLNKLIAGSSRHSEFAARGQSMRKFALTFVVGSAVCLSVLAAADVRCMAAEPPAHEKAAAKAGEHEEGVPLAFKSDLAMWSGITFVIFVFLLARFAWKPLIAALDKRESRIRDDISAAENARIKAEQMLAEHAKTLAKVQDEVRALLAQGRQDAERAKQEIIGEAQKEAEASKQRAVHEIGRARDSALKDLFDVMATQVAQATEHVLGRSLSGNDQDRLIDEALAQFPRS
jgi:F-type H+-transporting ATPase subunit b